MLKFGLYIIVLTFVGCASTSDNLQRESARSIGDVMPDAVQVSNIDRGATSVKWDASTAKGSYSCSADDMLRRVLCVKR